MSPDFTGPASASTDQGSQILLTGVTGFVGKVVLETLLRRRAEFNLQKVHVLIRPKKEMGAPERFKKMMASPCFANLAPDWEQYVEVVAGELTQPDLGIAATERLQLQAQLSEIINCAASVEFDLPLADAAQANITSALNVLEFARQSPALKSFVNVSTAYVTPHANDQSLVPEALVNLPFDPELVYQQILDGSADQVALMAQSGHPNTYTLTKCLSEHLLTRYKADVPLAIVRPSIISASWQFPQPGWIDSYAAFAGFVSLIGMGLLRAVVADENTILDVVPCDEVANSIVRAAFWQEPQPRPLIQHIVSGVDQGPQIGACIAGIERYFQHNPIHRWAKISRLSNGRSIRFQHLRDHAMPTYLASAACAITGKSKQRAQLKKMLNRIEYLNAAFPYFTHNSFVFESATPFAPPGFSPTKYVDLICEGVYRNMMRKEPSQTAFAGLQHRHPKRDLRWARQQSQGNWAIRSAAYVVRKGLRRCNDLISFDRGSFENAMAQVDPKSLLVVIPSHRSYMDFILCSYLFFAHPELKVPIPQIAAASEFARLPFLGWFFQQTYAFYIQRGKGQEDPHLTQKIQGLVDKNQTLEFFIEGTRSRARRFLQPKRGLLRALQNTDISATILPVAISYDLIPEAPSFLTELQGGPKPRTRMGALVKWLDRLRKGEINLGRVHIACGQPVRLDGESDVHQVSQQVMAELQAQTSVSRFHLNAFLQLHPVAGVDLEWLSEALRARGALVLESALQDQKESDPINEMTMRYHWLHYFYPDLLALKPDHQALAYHIQQNSYAAQWQSPAEPSNDQALLALLETLAEPILGAYAQIIGLAGEEAPFGDLPAISRRLSGSFQPYLEDALAHLCAKGILATTDNSPNFVRGSRWAESQPFYSASRWDPDAALIGKCKA